MFVGFGAADVEGQAMLQMRLERREGIEPFVLSLEDCSSTIELTRRLYT